MLIFRGVSIFPSKILKYRQRPKRQGFVENSPMAFFAALLQKPKPKQTATNWFRRSHLFSVLGKRRMWRGVSPKIGWQPQSLYNVCVFWIRRTPNLKKKQNRDIAASSMHNVLHKKSYWIFSEDVATSLSFDGSLWVHLELSKTDLFFVKVWGCCRVTGGRHLVNTMDLPRVKLLQDK